MPSPRAAKMPNATGVVWVSATPSAVPMKGAVQGLATAVASTPVSSEAPRPLPVWPPR